MALVDQITFERMSTDKQFNFCINSWGKSLESFIVAKDKIYPKEYWRKYHPIFTRHLLELPPLIAVIRDDPDCFLGWCCGKQGLLHYVYVKRTYTGNGVARELIFETCGTAPGVYTHETYFHEFINSLREKGWKNEGETDIKTKDTTASDEKSATDRAREDDNEVNTDTASLVQKQCAETGGSNDVPEGIVDQ